MEGVGLEDVKAEVEGPQVDNVSWVEGDGEEDGGVVDEGAVGAAQVLEEDLVGVFIEAAMVSGDGGVVEDGGAISRTADKEGQALKDKPPANILPLENSEYHPHKYISPEDLPPAFGYNGSPAERGPRKNIFQEACRLPASHIKKAIVNASG